MILFRKKTDLQTYLTTQKQRGKRIGFAPTMGALHQGHVSLIESSRKDNSITVSSIFVNPTQFNDLNDFKKYPVTIENDINKLEAAGCDLLFMPSIEEIYPGGTPSPMKYDLGYLETILEGKYRPGHFQGVCMVVHRLLDIVKPDNLYLGQKDYQQCMVIRKLIELTGHTEIKVNICPTFREPDGLAMSSRNLRLSKEERKIAPAIYRALLQIKENLPKGDLLSLKESAVKKLVENGLKPDYIEIADADTLKPISDPTAVGWNARQKLVVLAAAFLGEVRLIDNLVIN